VARQPLPPSAAAISFIDCINRGDLDGLTRLMTDDHTLIVLDEAPLVGLNANQDAWQGYFAAFPNYVIYPRHVIARGASVAVLGATTGSHLGLPDEEELNLQVVWLAETVEGRLSLWRVAEDTTELRSALGFPPQPVERP
jgi:ketosteroid isomerase-like protein